MVSQQRARGLMEHMEFVLHNILSNSRQFLGKIPRISTQDWNKIREWNKPPPSRSQQSVHGVIHHQYLKEPHALLALAPQLVEQGAKPGTFIPLLFEKSKWTIVAILGVMMSGAAFTLLDPSYRMQRLQTTCGNINGPLIVCSPICTGLPSVQWHLQFGG
ncbi:hypothetical protein FE257_003987 [Aspergillus nanangensis]|uniref:Uncharacterized protein n=1 Tax=Aspergillus nanangensis TaxID=2582783 RepID=A0AAD4GWB6_ASPNN|nr:hypothetical protein FE257_003987 [Aspergillus nanangensis]